MIPRARPLDKGLVVIFEGIDGVGKTTQLELVRKELEKSGWPVVTTRNMGGTPIGEALREVIKSPMKRPALTDFYISLAVQEPLLDMVDAAREEGKIILMDRGPLSLAAYQIYGSGVDGAVGWPHVEAGLARLKPDLTVLYDANPRTALGRLSPDSVKADYFESKPLAYFDRVAKGFKESAKRYGAVTIDAGRPIGEVHERTMSAIQHLFA